MAVFYKINNVDFDDYFVQRDLFSQGNLWSWGDNSSGQLGDETVVSKSSPVQTIAGGTNWKQVSNAGTQVGAIKTDGTLWLWGQNINGQLGDNTIVNKSSPIQTVSGGTNWKQVAIGPNLTAAIKTDGTLWTWGYGLEGGLGDDTSVSKSSPVQTVSGGYNWKQVEVGASQVASIKTDGTLWTWGNNDYGQLGDNTIVKKSSPVQTIAGGTDWQQVSVGNNFAAAIKTDGTLWTWGRNESGQLGDNTVTNKSSPIQTVAGGYNWKQVQCGISSMAAIKTDGTLWLWGHNLFGQLGDNTVTRKSSPVQTVAGGTNWKQVTCGTYYMLSIKTDGTLWAWGVNSSGQLGDNTVTNKSSPIQTVAGGTNWKQVTAGVGSSFAITDIY